MITTQSKERVLSYIDQGKADGASVVVDGRGLSLRVMRMVLCWGNAARPCET